MPLSLCASILRHQLRENPKQCFGRDSQVEMRIPTMNYNSIEERNAYGEILILPDT